LLKRRPDIEEIYGKVAGENGGKFDFAAFEKFVKEKQKVMSDLFDPRLIDPDCFVSRTNPRRT
jgi:hypothetical protein